MCINGVYQFSGIKSIETGVISKMSQHLIQSGSCSEKSYQDNFVLIGNDPLVSNDSRYVIAFDGNIYNKSSLKSRLDNFEFSTESNAEIALASYVKWGKNCVNHFDGVFALSIWDKQAKSMFIARDRMGVKPMYYVLDHDKIVFSSSVKSILNSDLVKRKLRKESVVDYFRFQTVHAPYTLIKDVYSLLPAQYMFFTEEKQELETYWSPSKTFIYPDSERKIVEDKVSDLLSEAVEKRTSKEASFKTFLSGNLNDSIICGLMTKKHNKKVESFSVVFDETKNNKSKALSKIAAHFNTNHHEVVMTSKECIEIIPNAIKLYDHPVGIGLSSSLLSQKAKNVDISNIQLGLGGDELFAGNPVFNQIPSIQSKKWLSSFPNYARKYPGIINHMLKGTVESSKYKEILKQEYFDSEYLYQFSRQKLMDDQLSKLIEMPKIPLNRVFEITHDLIGYRTDGWALPTLSRLSLAEFSTHFQNSILPGLFQVSKASSLDVRLPFLDHNLVEYSLGIKDKFKKPNIPNQLLLEMFNEPVSNEITDQTSEAFEFPYGEWMRGELKLFCVENLNELKNIPYIKGSGVDSLWGDFARNNKRVDWSRVWHLVVLGNWIKENNIEG